MSQFGSESGENHCGLPTVAQIGLKEFLLVWRRRCHTAQFSSSASMGRQQTNPPPQKLQGAKRWIYILRMSVKVVGGWRRRKVTPCCGEQGEAKLAKKYTQCLAAHN